MAGPNGDIYVADGYGNARIHRFNRQGKLLQSWGAPGTAPGEFMCAHSLWVHSDGRIFVCDRENSRIQIFDADGKLLETWDGITRPDDICIDVGGRVFISQEFMKAGHPRMEGGFYETSRPSTVMVCDLSGKELTSWGSEDEYAPGYFMSAHSLCTDLHGNVYVAETPFSDLGERYTPGIAKFVQKFRPHQHGDA
jgi:sugar lactone lactonase YvrE